MIIQLPVHAAGDEIPDLVGGQEIVREAEFDLAGQEPSRCTWSAVRLKSRQPRLSFSWVTVLASMSGMITPGCWAHPVNRHLRRHASNLVGYRRHLGSDGQVAIGLVPASGSPTGSGVPGLYLPVRTPAPNTLQGVTA